MILKFPNLDTLKLALSSGAVPHAVSIHAATAGFDAEGQVWIETAAALPRIAQAELKRLGILHVKTSGPPTTIAVNSWLELLPLQRDPTPPARPEQTPILFDVPGNDLAGLANEILRLGNDRQSFRWFGERALLRVIGPPYYSLLRALDRRVGGSPARIAGEPPTLRENPLVAYVERAPRVWIELGHTHPLAERIKAPEGQVLLLRPPRQWTVLDEALFRDLYDVLEFQLPAKPVQQREATLEQHIRVSLSLRAGGTTDGAELWVLRDDAVEHMNTFVQNADDQLLSRLRFAVAQSGEREIIILRIAPSKLSPPVLVLPAIGYRPYLKLPNLFLPCGQRLHPPLRRDQVRKLLADDPTQLVWLAPGPGNGFTPETLPENSFRPLSDWVDYVLDRDRVALSAWVQSMHFDFEAFICDDEGKPKKKAPPPAEKATRPASEAKRPAPSTAKPDVKEHRKAEAVEEELLDILPAEPDALELRRRALEEKFLEIEGGLDAPDRVQLWPELAQLNAALGLSDDAGICWMNALWPQDPVSADFARRWFRSESKGTSEFDSDLDQLLADALPSRAALRTLAAYVVWSARRTEVPAALRERLNPLQRFLEKHEHLLPIRAAWLAWYHLTQLSSGDVLALAHARDRLLERLFQNSLRPELDLPSFLRFAGQPSTQRLRPLCQFLRSLPDLARAWSAKTWSIGAATESTAAYIDLICAFGLARVGEVENAQSLIKRAEEVLVHKGDVHSFLFRAFDHRIRNALEGKPHSGPLPDELMAEVDHMDRMPRYLVERLAERSRILEPNRAIDPYRHWMVRDDPLAELVDVRDREEIKARTRKLLYETQEPYVRGLGERVLRVALEQAPCLGEEFGCELLDLVAPTYDAVIEPNDIQVLVHQARLLEKGLLVAAHYDRVEYVHPLLTRFRAMLRGQRGDSGAVAIESLAAQCFRGLRKLGMHDEIDSVLTEMAQILLADRDPRTLTASNLPTQPAALRALLHVAAGWYYFGRNDQADPVMQHVRAVLFQADAAMLPKDLSQLACTYASTAGQAPVEVAQQRLTDLFHKLPPIRDTLTTQTHYYLLILNVVEAVVLAVVGDDFALAGSARRWLDDDEYLVRQRIHRDWRASRKQGDG